MKSKIIVILAVLVLNAPTFAAGKNDNAPPLSLITTIANKCIRIFGDEVKEESVKVQRWKPVKQFYGRTIDYEKLNDADIANNITYKGNYDVDYVSKEHGLWKGKLIQISIQIRNSVLEAEGKFGHCRYTVNMNNQNYEIIDIKEKEEQAFRERREHDPHRCDGYTVELCSPPQQTGDAQIKTKVEEDLKRQLGDFINNNSAH